MKEPALWISNGGRVACAQHGGGYLEAAIRARPKARTHVTPLDHWTRATAADRAEWLAAVGTPLACETCAEIARPRAEVTS